MTVYAEPPLKPVEVFEESPPIDFMRIADAIEDPGWRALCEAVFLTALFQDYTYRVETEKQDPRFRKMDCAAFLFHFGLVCGDALSQIEHREAADRLGMQLAAELPEGLRAATIEVNRHNPNEVRARMIDVPPKKDERH